MRTRVKICGVTRIEDAQAAVAAGADAIGLIFDPKSPRVVELETARAIAGALPAFVAAVGVFVDATPDVVGAALRRVPLSLLQFHGAETPDYCRAHGRPYIKAISMKDDIDFSSEAKRFGDAAALLLDTYVADKAGGSGRSFDWSRVPARRTRPVILAGGLTPQNVGDAIRRVYPYAVDVVSGVEAAKGVKDHAKIRAFIDAVRGAA